MVLGYIIFCIEITMQLCNGSYSLAKTSASTLAEQTVKGGLFIAGKKFQYSERNWTIEKSWLRDVKFDFKLIKSVYWFVSFSSFSGSEKPAISLGISFLGRAPSC